MLSAVLTRFPYEQKPLSVRNISKNISIYELHRHNMWCPCCQDWRRWGEAAAPHPLNWWGLIEVGSTDPRGVKSICESSHSGLFSPACHCVCVTYYANGGRLEHTFVLKDVIITAFCAFDSHDKMTCSWLQSILNSEITKDCFQCQTTYFIYLVVMWHWIKN